jgi:hypothetical protein
VVRQVSNKSHSTIALDSKLGWVFYA